MCGIVGYIGRQEAATDRPRGTDPPRAPRLRLGGRRGARSHRGAQGGQAGRAGARPRPTRCPSASPARPGSATPGGPPTARPTTSTPTRTPTRQAGWPSCTTASSTTPRPCAPQLTDAGVTLASDTDTEVLAHLIARSDADTLEGKVRDALAAVVGTYGLAVLHADFPDRIVVARNGSPLDRRRRRQGDVRRLRPGRDRAAHHHRGDARRRRDGDRHGRRLHHDAPQRPHRDRRSPPAEVDVDASAYEAGEHESYMHKEMLEQPTDGAGRAPRPARRAVRHRPPRRTRHGRTRAPGGAAREDPGLRLGLLRRPDGRRADRGAGPHPRRRRGGERVPLPRPGHRARHPLRRGEPVGRDDRHPARGAGGTPQGRALRRPGQRRRLARSPASATAGSTCTPAPRSPSRAPRR